MSPCSLAFRVALPVLVVLAVVALCVQCLIAMAIDAAGPRTWRW